MLLWHALLYMKKGFFVVLAHLSLLTLLQDEAQADTFVACRCKAKLGLEEKRCLIARRCARLCARNTLCSGSSSAHGRC